MSNTSDEKICEKTVADCPNSFFTVDQKTCECKCTELVCIATMSVDTDKCECVPIPDFGKKPSKVTDINSDGEGSDHTHYHNGYEHSHPHSGQNKKPKNDYYLVDPNQHDPQEHENTHEHAAIMAKLKALEDAMIKAKE